MSGEAFTASGIFCAEAFGTQIAKKLTKTTDKINR